MKRVYLHSLPLRLWHWVNAPLVILLLLTGIHFRIPGIAALRPHDPWLAVHQWAGVAMAASWLFWFVHGLASRHFVRHYAFRRSDIGRMAEQTRYYLVHIFRGGKNPFHPSPGEKLNALQKLAYGTVMGVVAPVMIVTGLFFAAGFRAGGELMSADTIRAIDALHVTGLYVFALFLVIHVYMATLGPTVLTHVKAMFTGYKEHPGEDAPAAVPEAVAAENTRT